MGPGIFRVRPRPCRLGEELRCLLAAGLRKTRRRPESRRARAVLLHRKGVFDLDDAEKLPREIPGMEVVELDGSDFGPRPLDGSRGEAPAAEGDGRLPGRRRPMSRRAACLYDVRELRARAECEEARLAEQEAALRRMPHTRAVFRYTDSSGRRFAARVVSSPSGCFAMLPCAQAGGYLPVLVCELPTGSWRGFLVGGDGSFEPMRRRSALSGVAEMGLFGAADAAIAALREQGSDGF